MTMRRNETEGRRMKRPWRFGWFYMIQTEDRPDAITFGVSSDPERRFLHYWLDSGAVGPGVTVIGIWKFHTIEDAYAFEAMVKGEMRAGVIAHALVASPGRVTESITLDAAVALEQILDGIPGVHQMTYRDRGPWRGVTLRTWRRNHPGPDPYWLIEAIRGRAT